MQFWQKMCILDALSITMHMIDHENPGKNQCKMTSVTWCARRPAIPQRTSQLVSHHTRQGPQNDSEARYLRARGSCQVQLSGITTSQDWLASRNMRGGPRNHLEAQYLSPGGSCRVQLSKTTTWLARVNKRMMLKYDDDHCSSEQLSIIPLILWFYVEAQTEMMREDSFLAGRKEWK